MRGSLAKIELGAIAAHASLGPGVGDPTSRSRGGGFLLRAAIVMFLGFSCLSSLSAAAGAKPILYSSWHHAYGQPGACDTLTGRCDDSGADTLCLSFDPGEDIPTFFAASVTVGFHVLAGDSLSERWQFGGGEGNDFNVRVVADVEPTPATHRPWAANPVGGVRYDFVRLHGYLRMVYAQSYKTPSRLERGKRYWIAKVVIPRPPRGVPLCDQPMCIEFSSLTLTTSVAADAKDLVGTGGEQSSVTMNAADRSACGRVLESRRPGAWHPWRR